MKESTSRLHTFFDGLHEKHSSRLLSSYIACEWMSINFAVIEKPIVSVHKIARAAVSESTLNLASVKSEIIREITQM